MTIDEWIAVGVAVAAVAAVFVSAIGVWMAANGIRDQLRLTTFVAYTERYARIMSKLPDEVRRPGSRYQLADATATERREMNATFRDYFNLCSEELFLHTSGKIDDKTWQAWALGIEDVMRFPPAAELWQYLGPEYVCYPEFRAFMQEVLAKSGTQPVAPA